MAWHTLFTGYVYNASSVFPDIGQGAEHPFITILRPDGTVVVDHMNGEYEGSYDRIYFSYSVCEEEYLKWVNSSEVVIVVNSCENHRCAVYCPNISPLYVPYLNGAHGLQFYLNQSISIPGSGGGIDPEVFQRIEDGLNNIYYEASNGRYYSYLAYTQTTSAITRLTTLDTKLNSISNQISTMSSSLDQTNAWGNASSASLAKIASATIDPPLWVNARGLAVNALQTKLTSAGYALPDRETSAQVYGETTAAAVTSVQKKYNLPATGRADAETMKAIDDASQRYSVRRISGTIVTHQGRPGSGLRLRLMARNAKGASSQIGQNFDVNKDARFEFVIADRAIDLSQASVQAMDSGGYYWTNLTKPFSVNDTFTMLCLVAQPSAYVNTSIAPDLTLTEYDRLNAALASAIGTNWQSYIGGMIESSSTKDITALHEKTGWDARLIALRIAAANLRNRTPLPEQAMYGLFRMGLPTELAELAKTPRSAAQSALSKAASSKIIAADSSGAYLHFSDGTQASTVDSYRIIYTRLPGSNYTGQALAEYLYNRLGLMSDCYALAERLLSKRCSYDELIQIAVDNGEHMYLAQLLKPFGYWMNLTQNSVELSAHLTTYMRDNFGMIDYDAVEAKFEILRRFGTVEQWLGHIDLFDPYYAIPGREHDISIRVLIYVQELARKVRGASPLMALLVDWNEGAVNLPNDLVPGMWFLYWACIDCQLDFEIDTGSVRQLDMRAMEQGFGSYGEPGIENAEAIQRIYQLSPSITWFEALLNAGFRSAQDIIQIPRQRFIENYADVLGVGIPAPEEASLVYERAVQITQIAHNTASAIRIQNSLPPIAAVPAGSATSGGAMALQAMANSSISQQFPTLERLFGTFDRVEVGDARSALSPAAYFVDLLNFIDTNNVSPTPYDVLTKGTKFDGNTGLSRRPDIPHLALTNENTLTMLPYIDLVNEVLEYVTVGKSIGSTAFHGHDTKTEAREELIAEPAHILEDAYIPLRQKEYPLSLPFDLPLETSRQLLDQLALPLHKSMEVFRNGSDRKGILLERLGLCPREYEVLTRNYTSNNWYTLYGDTAARTRSNLAELATRLEISQRDLVNLLETRSVNPSLDQLAVLRKLGITPMAFNRVVRGRTANNLIASLAAQTDDTAQAVLARLYEAKEMCAQTGTDFTAGVLTPLCETATANAVDQTVVVVETTSSSGESVREVRFANPASTVIDWSVQVRLNLFVRLWKKLGWSIEEVDRVLTFFVSATGSLGDALPQLGDYLELAERLGWETPSQRQRSLTIWSQIATTGMRPTYDVLFLTATGRKARRIDNSQKPLFDSWTSTVLASPENLSHHHAVVEALLGISERDLRIILETTGRPYDSVVLDLPLLSLIDAHVVIAKALDLTINDLATVMRLTGTTSCHFIEGGTFGAKFQATVAFAQKVLALKESGLGITDAGQLFTPSDDESWEARYEPLPGEFYDAVTQSLALGFTLVQGTSPSVQLLVPGEVPSTCGAAQGCTHVEVHGFFEVPRSGDYQLTIASLDEQDTPTSFRLALKVNGKSVVNDDEFSGGGVVSLVGLTSKTPFEFSLEADDAQLPRLKLLIQESGLDKEEKEEADPVIWRPQRQIRRSLAKARHLVDTLKLSVREVAFIATHPASFEGFAFPSLSKTEGGAPLLPVSLISYAGLKDHSMVKAPSSLVEVLDSDEKAAALALATGLSVADIEGAAALIGVGADGAIQIPPIKGLARLLSALEMARKLSLSSAQAIQGLAAAWETPGTPIPYTTARALRDTLKSHFRSEQEWRRAIKPVSDRLRKTRRDRLVSYLLPLCKLTRPEELYEYLLIDPMTEPIVETSRLLFMTASVQLFIQRCLMNMEPAVSPDAIDREEWEWMKRYRVWEANRKVFLYPENWLEPEFRIDKSHLFGQFESALLEGDVTDDLAERAFGAYLREFEAIARLRVVASYVEEDASSSGQELLHVIGRTEAQPYKYFYRSLAAGVWTAWEPVRFDSNSDLLALLRWKGRLTLFGASVVDLPNKDETVESSASYDGDTATVEATPKKQITGARISWIERSNGEWGTDSSAETIELWRPPVPWQGITPIEWTIPMSPYSVATNAATEDEPERSGLFLHATLDDAGDVVILHFANALANASQRCAVIFASRNTAPKVDASAYSEFVDNPLKTTTYRGSLLTGDTRLDAREPGFSNFGSKESYWTVLNNAGKRWSVCVPSHIDGWVKNRKLTYFYQDENHCFLVQQAATRRWVVPNAILAKDYMLLPQRSRGLELANKVQYGSIVPSWPLPEWQTQAWAASPQAAYTSFAQDAITAASAVVNLSAVSSSPVYEVTLLTADGSITAKQTTSGDIVLKDGKGNEAIGTVANDKFSVKQVVSVQQALIGETPTSSQFVAGKTFGVSAGATLGAGLALTFSR